MEKRLWIGTDVLRGDIQRYAGRFDLLELRAELGRTPRPALLRTLRARAPRDFVFSVRVPKLLGELATDEPPASDIEHARAAADALAARWLVVQTPPSATPSARTRERLAGLIARLAGEQSIAWEPRGVWADVEAEALARELNLHLVRDLTRVAAPEADILYCRLGAFGGGLGSDALERVAEALATSREAYVVIAGSTAARAARQLRELAGRL